MVRRIEKRKSDRKAFRVLAPRDRKVVHEYLMASEKGIDGGMMKVGEQLMHTRRNSNCQKQL